MLSTLLKPRDALRIQQYLSREIRHLEKGCTLFPDTGTPLVNMCFYPSSWLAERKIDPRILHECVVLTSGLGKVRYFTTQVDINPAILVKRTSKDAIQCICFLV